MNFNLVNNFSQALASTLGANPTIDVTITLDANASKLSDAAPWSVYPLTLFEVDAQGAPTGKLEIVYVTGYNNGVLSIERGREGTSVSTWPAGTPVEVRNTAGVLAKQREAKFFPAKFDSGPEKAAVQAVDGAAFRSCVLSNNGEMIFASTDVKDGTMSTGYVFHHDGSLLLDLGPGEGAGNAGSNKWHTAKFSDDDTKLTILSKSYESTSGSSHTGRIVQYDTSTWTKNFDLDMNTAATQAAFQGLSVFGFDELADGRLIVGTQDSTLIDGTTVALAFVIDPADGSVEAFGQSTVVDGKVRDVAIDESRQKVIVTLMWGATNGPVHVFDYDSIGGTLTPDPTVASNLSSATTLPDSLGNIVRKDNLVYATALELVSWSSSVAVKIDLETGDVLLPEAVAVDDDSFRGDTHVDFENRWVLAARYGELYVYDADSMEEVGRVDAGKAGIYLHHIGYAKNRLYVLGLDLTSNKFLYTDDFHAAMSGNVDYGRAMFHGVGMVKLVTPATATALEGAGELVAVGPYAVAADKSTAVGCSAEATGSDATAVGYTAVASGTSSIAIGRYTKALAGKAFCVGLSGKVESLSGTGIGYYARVGEGSDYGIAIGDSAHVQSNSPYAIALGSGVSVSGTDSVAIGKAVATAASRTVTINTNWNNSGYSSVAIGWWALVGEEGPAGDYSTAIGASATVSSDNSVCIGRHAYANPNAENSVALGVGARASVKGGFRLNAIPYLAADPDSDEVAATNAGFPDAIATQDAISRRVSQQAVFVTDALDLTSGSAAVTLDLPAGTMLFIDAIDVVVTGSSSPGGSPEIVVGPDGVTPAAYLAATAVGKTAVGGRETHSPLVADGVTSLRVATSTAGTGTTYEAKIVFRGYVMEV